MARVPLPAKRNGWNGWLEASACQTGGRLLADRALSQLLKKDWPKTLEELEAKKQEGKRRESSV
jgi:hypothetical protein